MSSQFSFVIILRAKEEDNSPLKFSLTRKMIPINFSDDRQKKALALQCNSSENLGRYILFSLLLPLATPMSQKHLFCCTQDNSMVRTGSNLLVLQSQFISAKNSEIMQRKTKCYFLHRYNLLKPMKALNSQFFDAIRVN